MNVEQLKIFFVHILTCKLSRMLKMVFQKPSKKRQKESSEELSQVETTTGQNRVDAVTVFPLKMIPF